MLPVETFTGTTAAFEREPNPHAPEPAGYEFLYTPGNVACQGTVLPAGPEISRPAATKVSEPVVGLEGSTTVCMDASITEGGVTEMTASNTVTFKTLPEKPFAAGEWRSFTTTTFLSPFTEAPPSIPLHVSSEPEERSPRDHSKKPRGSRKR